MIIIGILIIFGFNWCIALLCIALLFNDIEDPSLFIGSFIIAIIVLCLQLGIWSQKDVNDNISPDEVSKNNSSPKTPVDYDCSTQNLQNDHSEASIERISPKSESDTETIANVIKDKETQKISPVSTSTRVSNSSLCNWIPKNPQAGALGKTRISLAEERFRDTDYFGKTNRYDNCYWEEDRDAYEQAGYCSYFIDSD